MLRSATVISCFLLIVAMSHARAAEPAAGFDTPRIIVLEFHGLKKDIVERNLDRLPHFREIIQGQSGQQAYVHLPSVATTIPAASVPACTAMYTGRFPQNTGVVSTIWFDRRSARVHTMISYSQRRINRILAQNRVDTIFDYVGAAGKRTLSVMLMIDKGAQRSIKSGMFFWGNASTVGFVNRGVWFPDPWYMDHKTISGLLNGHVFAYGNSLSGILDKEGRLPDLTVVQLLGMDIYSHFPDRDLVARHASMDDIQTHYTVTVLDPLLGRVIRFLKQKGRYDRTVFFLISQQGSVKITKHIRDDILNTALESHYKLPGPSTSNQAAEAAIMLGACTKEVYLKNRGTGRWLDPPRLLEDVKPAVDAIVAVPEVQQGLNQMIIRQYPGERREGVVENDVWWGFDWKAYRQGSKTEADFRESLLPFDEALRHFELSEYIHTGLTHQYTRDTAPDIKLINQKGVYFERDFNKYGHHGSYYPDDSILSFWIAGPGLSPAITGRHRLHRQASTLDLIPMVAALLNMEIPPGLDGDNPLAEWMVPRR